MGTPVFGSEKNGTSDRRIIRYQGGLDKRQGTMAHPDTGTPG